MLKLKLQSLASWCKELTHWKRPWCWVRLKAGGEGDNRGWDGWMASQTQWTWVWVSSWSWWWTGKPGILQSMGLQRVGHNEQPNWIELASIWDECNCAVVWTFFGIAFLWIGMKTDLFQSCGHCWVFQICWHTECSTLIASSFRIWNSSAGIPSPLLALFVVMLPKAHLTLHSRMSGLDEWSHHHGYPGH